MAEAFEYELEVEGHHWLVLDDENVGGDLLADLGAGFSEQLADAALGRLENLRGIRGAEALHRDKDERLAAFRRERSQGPRRRIADQAAGAGPEVAIAARERLQEALVEPEPRRQVGKHRRVGCNDLQARARPPRRRRFAIP